MHDHMVIAIYYFIIINRTDLRPSFELRTAGVGLLKFQSLKICSCVVKLLTFWISVWWFMKNFPTISNFKRIHIRDSIRDVVVLCLVACCSYQQVTRTTVTNLITSVMFFFQYKTSEATLIWTVRLNVTICKDSIGMHRLKCVCVCCSMLMRMWRGCC